MPTISQLKEREVLDTPVILFDCTLPDGSVERWSTHQVSISGDSYAPRVLGHNVFEFRQSADEMTDGSARLTLKLANADSYFSQIELTRGGLKGSRLSARFGFFDLATGTATSDLKWLFRGSCSGTEELAESYCRVSFNSLLNFQRVQVPTRRIQRSCPWIFPRTLAERTEAVGGGAYGKYSLFYGCGYSADVAGGVGNRSNGVVFSECDYSRANCGERGMLRADENGTPTRRFGGTQFLPASTLVRSYGEKGFHSSTVTPNESKYNDPVPLIYGTGWYSPPVAFAYNDGNLTRMEVLLGSGEMEAVRKVLVNQIEIPAAEPGKDMTATGWFELVSAGGRMGAFNADVQDSAGNPLGDPYGSMAYLSVVVPNRFAGNGRLPRVDVLADGLKLPRFDTDGQYLGEFFSNNPAWVVLDVLRRTGWKLDEIDVPSFSAAAQYCEELIAAEDANGGAVNIQRYRCNLMLTRRRSVGDVLRGIRNTAGLALTYGTDGKVALTAESTLVRQQAQKPAGSNASSALNGGWPAYEFGDGSTAASGICVRDDGSPTLRFWAKPSWDTVNRMQVEFQDEFNLYQQDSVSLVDVEDVRLVGQEVAATYPGLGIPNANQAIRLMRRRLNQSIRGNLYAEFETSVRGVSLGPGDIITITYQKNGLSRVPFRILRLTPDVNYRRVKVTAQLHDDAWYQDSLEALGPISRNTRPDGGVPRPLAGTVLDVHGEQQFGVEETVQEAADGGSIVQLDVAFVVPPAAQVGQFAAPILAVSPQVDTAGGTLAGDQSLYYAVTAVDASANESSLSIVVRAVVPGTTNTNRVMLTGLSFPEGSTGFRVYRGTDPQRLQLIAANSVVASTFQDTGVASQLFVPPDSNFDHANFYWRYEVLPPTVVVTGSATTIANSSLSLTADELRGRIVRVVSGKGNGQEREVESNTATQITVSQAWSVVPDGTSAFTIADAGWNFGVGTKSSPARFVVPNRRSLVVQISGRAANSLNVESPSEAGVITRWTIGGGAGGGGDVETPPAPFFALAPSSIGNVELVSVSFSDLTNTRSIESGAVTLLYWDETTGPNSFQLAAGINATATTLDLNSAGPATAGDHIQIGSEVIRVDAVTNGGTRYQVTRGTHGTTAVSHDPATLVFHLNIRTFVVAFPREFFGSPASGSYRHPFFLPSVRIAAAEMYVSNSRGNSPTARINYTGTVDQGLRIFAGSQYALQVEGNLAIQQGATPPVTISQTRSVRDIRARVAVPPVGAPVDVRVMKDGVAYCTVTIPAAAYTSTAVNGFNLAPLVAQNVLTLDVVSVGQTAATTPGRDLTVTIRV